MSAFTFKCIDCSSLFALPCTSGRQVFCHFLYVTDKGVKQGTQDRLLQEFFHYQSSCRVHFNHHSLILKFVFLPIWLSTNPDCNLLPWTKVTDEHWGKSKWWASQPYLSAATVTHLTQHQAFSTNATVTALIAFDVPSKSQLQLSLDFPNIITTHTGNVSTFLLWILYLPLHVWHLLEMKLC